jgi:outer membrane lipoprotein-sorting protein
MRNLFFVFLAMLQLPLFAQNEEVDADIVLDKALASIKADLPVRMDYDYKVFDDNTELLLNDKGIIYIDDNRYALLMQDMKVWCDGETQWSYMREINEVYITDAAADEAQNLSPLYVMEHYREGFSRSAVSKDGFTAVMLKAMNEDSDVECVLLLISEENYRLVSMIISMPGQGVVEIDLDGYVAKCGVDDDVFTCPLDDFREAEVIDMR